MSEDKKEDKPYFDDEKRRIAVEWIKTECPNLTCECCGTKGWELGLDIVTPPIFEGGMMIGGRAYPLFMLICKKCANTKFFNAMIAKVLKNEKKEDANVKSS